MGFLASVHVMKLSAAIGQRDAGIAFSIVPLSGILFFAVVIALAVANTRKPEIHKRLILLATVALLFAAVGRMNLFQRPLLFLTVWLSPVLLGMGYDVLTRRRVHPTYMIGLAALLLGFSRVLFLQSEAWLRIGRALIGMFA